MTTWCVYTRDPAGALTQVQVIYASTQGVPRIGDRIEFGTADSDAVAYRIEDVRWLYDAKAKAPHTIQFICHIEDS